MNFKLNKLLIFITMFLFIGSVFGSGLDVSLSADLITDNQLTLDVTVYMSGLGQQLDDGANLNLILNGVNYVISSEQLITENTYEFNLDFQDDNIIQLDNIINIELLKDGNILVTGSVSFGMDTKNAEVVNLVYNPSLVFPDFVQELEITFDKEMDTSVFPEIKLYNNSTGELMNVNYILQYPEWISSTTFSVDIVFNSNVIGIALLNIENAKDISQNTQIPFMAESIGGVTYGGFLLIINGLIPKPVVVNLDYVPIITDNNLVQELTVTFDTEMNISNFPQILFENTNSNYTFIEGNWIDSKNYYCKFLFEDNRLSENILINISNAIDVNGLTQLSDLQHFFLVHTINANVGITLSNNMITDVDLYQDITVEYDLVMNQATVPELTISDIQSGYTILSEYWVNNTIYIFKLVYNDDNISEMPVLQTKNAEDTFGNKQSNGIGIAYIIDTINLDGNMMNSSSILNSNNLTQEVYVSYNRDMNTDKITEIEFINTADLPIIVPISVDYNLISNGWNDNRTFHAVYLFTDQDNEFNISTRGLNSQDVYGNVLSEIISEDSFLLDSKNPTISYYYNYINLIDINTFEMISSFEFDENMDLSSNLKIQINSVDQNVIIYTNNWIANNKLLFKSSDFNLYFDLSQFEMYDIVVSLAKDIAGNNMNEFIYEYVVDSKPEVVNILFDAMVYDLDLDQNIFVEFSKEMNTNYYPLIEFIDENGFVINTTYTLTSENWINSNIYNA